METPPGEYVEEQGGKAPVESTRGQTEGRNQTISWLGLQRPAGVQSAQM